MTNSNSNVGVEEWPGITKISQIKAAKLEEKITGVEKQKGYLESSRSETKSEGAASPKEAHREGIRRVSTKNWIKDLLGMAPPIRTRPSCTLSQSQQVKGQQSFAKRTQWS